MFAQLCKYLMQEKPSEYLKDFDFSEMPEILALKNCPQSPIHHPEGDVFNHTLLVVDQAAKIVRQYDMSFKNAMLFMLSALCHDFGKPVTTVVKQDKITSYNHDVAGVTITEQFLFRYLNDKESIKYIANMVKNHMRPFFLIKDKNATDKALKRFAEDCINPEHVVLLSICDHKGRLGHENDDMSEFFAFLQKIKTL